MTLLVGALDSLGFGVAMGGSVLSIVGVFVQRPKWDYAGAGIAAVGCWMEFVSGVLTGDLNSAVVTGLCGAWWTWHWWRKRPRGRRRKALKAFGAKSKARIQALVRQMTPSPIPSPVGA